MAIDYTDFVKTTFICSCCHEPLPINNFYKSSSRHYIGTGHLCTCKKCLINLFQEYTIEYGSRRKALQRLCMAYDIYYNESVFVSCNDEELPFQTVLGNYIKRMNIKPNKDRTFDNTINEGFHFQAQDDVSVSIGEKDEDGEALVNPALIKKWGKDLQPDDYDVLEEHYNYLKTANPNLNDNQEVYITELCYTKMFQMRALRNSETDQFGKMSDTYRKIFTQAGLKAVREIESNSDDCLGEWTRRIEEYTPAEYYKNKTLFKDNDNIGGYIDRFLLRPLRNLIHGTSDRDYEYSIKDDDTESAD